MNTSSIDVREDLVRRLAAAARGATLYEPNHPIVERGLDALARLCSTALCRTDSIVIAALGDEIVVDGKRLRKTATSLVGFARELRAQQVEKITIARGVTREDLRGFVSTLAKRSAAAPLARRPRGTSRGGVTVGLIRSPESNLPAGMTTARKVYASAVHTAQSLWEQARAGDTPDPRAARSVIDSLAKVLTDHRSPLMALTALKKYEIFMFTHMVNVAVLTMAQARALGIEGSLLREFGFAALMHDIGKVRTPVEVLDKPGKLTRDEFAVMKRHVIDGAHILRKTPEVPALAPVVAFEHHLGQDLSGYPENIAHRRLNLCTQIVSIADVYDALRSDRVYREGMPTERVRSIMEATDNPAFNRKLLRRFINLVGLFPVGTLVRLQSGEVAVVAREHPRYPFCPQVKVLLDSDGVALSASTVVNTWEPRAVHRGVVEAVDPDAVRIDPLEHL